MSVLLFDLETDGFYDETTRIWCAAVCDVATGDIELYDPEHLPISSLFRRLEKASVLIAHNGAGFDVPVLCKLMPTFKVPSIRDTLPWARVAFPDIKGSDFILARKNLLPGNLIGRHSLEAWGYRLGEYKGDWKDFSKWTPQMSQYCRQDVEVLFKLYNYLLSRGVPDSVVEMETEVAYLIGEQTRNGFLFDLEKAEALHIKLKERQVELATALQFAFPPRYYPGKGFIPKARNKRLGYYPGAAMTRIELVKFNPNSSNQIATEFKRKYGWEPVKLTEKTEAPVIDEEVLDSLPYPEAKLLSEFKLLEKRIGMLSSGNQAWLSCYNPKTKRIHGSVNSCGAVTGRMTHHHPNIAQTPASYSPYGKECRELFTVPNGFKLVGCDASGLELRMLAHYMAKYDGGAYGKTVIEGKKEDGTDIHSVNMKALGIDSRDDAKTYIYAYL